MLLLYAHAWAFYRVGVLAKLDCTLHPLPVFACAAYTPQEVSAADDQATFRVLVENTGNVHLKGMALSVSNVTDLLCKSGTTGTAGTTLQDDDTVWGLTQFTISSPFQLNAGTKLVCQGTFTFTQAVIDDNTLPSNVFTVTATATNTNLTYNASAPVATYSDSAVISIAAAPALLTHIKGANCIIPSIIPDGAASESE